MTTNFNSKTEQLLTLYKEGQRNFKGFSLTQGNLAQSKLPLIAMEDANLEEINFEKANLMGATFNRSNLKNANLKNANLMGADLVKVELENSNLSKALVSGANLSASNLQYSDLSGATFVGSDLTATDLRGANLRGTNFKGANLRGANFLETNLDYAILDYSDLKHSIIPEELREKIFSPRQDEPKNSYLKPIFYEDDSNYNQSENNDHEENTYQIETENNQAENEDNQAQFFSSEDHQNLTSSDEVYNSYLSEFGENTQANELQIDNLDSSFLEFDDHEYEQDQGDQAVIFPQNLEDLDSLLDDDYFPQENEDYSLSELGENDDQSQSNVTDDLIENNPLGTILETYKWFDDSEEIEETDNNILEISASFSDVNYNENAENLDSIEHLNEGLNKDNNGEEKDNNFFSEREENLTQNLSNGAENYELGNILDDVLNSDHELLNKIEETEFNYVEMSDPFLEIPPTENLINEDNNEEEKDNNLFPEREENLTQNLSNGAENYELGNILDDILDPDDQWFNESEEIEVTMLEMTDPFLEISQNLDNIDHLDSIDNLDNIDHLDSIDHLEDDQEWFKESEEIEVNNVQLSDSFLKVAENENELNINLAENLDNLLNEDRVLENQIKELNQEINEFLIEERETENINDLEAYNNKATFILNDSEKDLPEIEDNLDSSFLEENEEILSQSFTENETENVNNFFDLERDDQEIIEKPTLIDEPDLSLSLDDNLIGNEEISSLFFTEAINKSEEKVEKATLIDEPDLSLSLDDNLIKNEEISSLFFTEDINKSEEKVEKATLIDEQDLDLSLDDNLIENEEISSLFFTEDINKSEEKVEKATLIDEQDLGLSLDDNLIENEEISSLFFTEDISNSEEIIEKATLIDEQDLGLSLDDNLIENEEISSLFFTEDISNSDDHDTTNENDDFFAMPTSSYLGISFGEESNENESELVNNVLSSGYLTEIEDLDNNDNSQMLIDANFSSNQISQIEEILPEISELESQEEIDQNIEIEQNEELEKEKLAKEKMAKTTFIQKLNNPVIETIQSVLNNRVQYHFKKQVLEVYKNQCVITQCNILPLLEVVMIDPLAQEMQDHPSNGLVLRRDLSVLFELYLLAINPSDFSIIISPTVKNSEYQALNGQKIMLPSSESVQPNSKFLTAHLKNCSWCKLTLDQLAKQSQNQGLTSSKLSNNTLKNQDKLTEKNNSLAMVKNYLTSKTEQPRWLNLGLAGITVFSLLGLFLLNNSSINKKSGVVTSNNEDLKTIDIQLGDLIYEDNGLINQENTYFSLPILTHLGVNTGNIKPEGNLIKLEFSETLKTKFIDFKIKDKIYQKEGLIIEITSTSYIPIKFIQKLGLKESTIPENQTITYKDVTYIKTSELKKLGIKIGWDAQSSTLSLNN